MSKDHGATCEKCILYASGVGFAYPEGRKVLDDVSVCIAPGEMLTLLGPNGAGKSTLLNCLVGALVPQEGKVVLEGRDVAKLMPRDIARCVAYVPQTSSSAYGYRVRDYVAMGRAPYKNVFQHPDACDREIVGQAMAQLGIERLADKAYTQLSGGERQLVNVCRALVQQPKVILFDEPTSALDYGNQIKVLRLVSRLREEGYAIIMTTHNPDHPILLGGRVAILDCDGHLDCGGVKKMMTQERLSDLYQTDLRVLHIDELGRDACMPPGL